MMILTETVPSGELVAVFIVSPRNTSWSSFSFHLDTSITILNIGLHL